MTNTILEQIRQELKNSADEQTLISSKRFFKEEIKVYGVKSAGVNKVAKHYFGEVKNLSKQEIFDLCEELWKSGYIEEAVIACNWSEALHIKYEPADFKIFERWVKNDVTNWATCDTLCNHTVATIVMMYPEFISELKKWATSSNRWVKRASAVTLIIPARKGLFLKDIFEIANTLLLDEDDLVQKGYGWMLKAASEARLQEVFDFVNRHKAVMPRTALRYAIEKMPQKMKTEAMKK